MEAINEGQQGRETTGWDAWDAVPRDGPAVFVVDADAFDRGEVHGAWINPFIAREAIDQQLRELLGGALEQGRWAIIDQIGFGSGSVDETPESLSLGALFSEPREDEL